MEKQRQSSDLSENRWQDSSRGSPGRGLAPGVGHSLDSDGTLRSFSGLSPLRWGCSRLAGTRTRVLLKGGASPV